MGRPFIDITGQRYGRLVAISRQYLLGHREYWLCQCDCGNRVVVAKSDMRSGVTRSCGCFKKEKLIERNHKRKKK